MTVLHKLIEEMRKTNAPESCIMLAKSFINEERNQIEQAFTDGSDDEYQYLIQGKERTYSSAYYHIIKYEPRTISPVQK